MKNKEVVKEKKGNKGSTEDLYASNEQGHSEDKKDDLKENKSKKEASKDGKEARDAKSLRAKFQLRRDKNHALRFEGEGVNFKAKMIGIEKVEDARGDKMCQDSLQRLKAAVKLTGEHKQRILLAISLDGIKIKDEKSGEHLYHHPVHKISFISQDVGDARAFGYIFGAPHNGHEFFAIKTEKSASNVVIALRDLFQMVLQIKKQEMEKVKQQQENVDAFRTDEKSQVIGANTREAATRQDSNISQEEPVYADIISLSEEDRPCSPKLPYSSVSSSSREMNTIDSLLDFQFEVDCLQQGIAQMDSSIAAAASVNNSFDMELPFPLSNPLLSATQADHVASSHQKDISTSELAVGASPSQSIASISDSKDTPVSDAGNLSDSITNETCKESSSPTRVEDRYAVFSDLDSLPSIFDNPHIVEIPTSHNEVQENDNCSLQDQDYECDEDAMSNDIPSFPPPVLPRSPKSLNTAIFADLDPLGKNRYVDKKDFFQELKNPPKKVLKDLAGDDLDNDLSFIEFSYSPRSSISDSSTGFASVCSNNSNPFRSEFEGCSSPPPPQLPPKQFSINNNDSEHDQDFHENVSWDISNSPSHSPFNPFIVSCAPNFPPPSTPPPPPPPLRLPATGSEPLFQTAASPPPRPPSRNCATPTPPLPRRKISHHNKLRSYASVEDSCSNKSGSISNGDAFSPPLPLPARKPPLPCRTNSPLLGNNSPLNTRRYLTRSPASIDTDSPFTSVHFSKNSSLINEINSFPVTDDLNNSERAVHQKSNNLSLPSMSSSLSRVKNSYETIKQLHTANGASSTVTLLPSPPLPSRPPQRSPRSFITSNSISDDSLHVSNSSISPAKNGVANNKQEEKITENEHNGIIDDSKIEVSGESSSDSSVPNIFCRKSDPFDDDFFTTLPKKVSSQSKKRCEIVKGDDYEYNINSGEG